VTPWEAPGKETHNTNIYKSDWSLKAAKVF